MQIIKDYLSYMSEEESFLNEIKKLPQLYFLLEDLIKVLNYIAKCYQEQEKISSEYEELFNVGFHYLTEVMIDLKQYLNEYLNNDQQLYDYYQQLIVISIFVEDIRGYLVVEELLTDEKDQIISTFQEQIETWIANQQPIDSEWVEEQSNLIDNMISDKKKFCPIYSLYGYFAEEFGLI